MANNIQKKYVTLSDIDHVLLRPEVNIGSTEPVEHLEYIVDENFTTITEKTVIISEALVRIFVEVLANAVDNIQRSKNSSTPCKCIKIEIDEDGRTMVHNDGQIIKITKDENDGVEIEGKKCLVYNHELVFGHLRSGSNYDDTIVRETSGKNGIGVKCTNILSSSFKVIGVDPENRKKLIQEWTNNMKNTAGPIVSSSSVKVGYTEIIYYPDFSKLGSKNKYSSDAIGIFRKHVLDVAMLASSEGVSVYFNNKKLPIKKFSDYTKFFKEDVNEKEIVSISEEDKSSEVTIIFVKGEGMKKRPISFVNGLFTKDGGQHVDGWTKPFFANLLAALNKPSRGKDKDLKMTQKDVVPYFRFFVRSTVDKPQFDCQNKNRLKFPNLKYTIPDKVISKVCKWSSVQELKEKIHEKMVAGKNLNIIKTLNDKKRRPKVSVKEYDPANNAGTSRSSKCILIVCEGLSAKTYAVAGINTGVSIPLLSGQEETRKGRDWFGILPLRGKFLNVRNASNDKMIKNTVVTDLVNAMGLTFGMDYTTQKARNSLNYGSIMIIPDPDEDGIHIEGLVLNFFHHHFPTLFKTDTSVFPFMSSMKIPIIKVTGQNINKEFFTHEAFNRTKEENKWGKNYKIKYFKGLGTTKYEDVPKIFGKKMVVFHADLLADENMEKAFKDEEADERKEWLKQYNPKNRTFDLDYPDKVLQLDISTFVNEELIKFSIEDCKRSLPHLMDGQKESQRKVIFGLKQWNGKKDGNLRDSIKVAQLGAFVAQKTDYKHGEQNLFDTIIKMAQDFVGSNNLPLLERDGQFGTRLSGGKDSASPRYIYVKQPPILNKIFRPEDDPILDYVEDGEPTFYAPVLPLICINGSVGVGTGFSCNIPMFNPKDILLGIKQWINMRDIGEKYVFKYKPWYKNFIGEIEKNGGSGRYASYGIVTKLNDDKKKEYKVSELPINMWSDKFKEICEQLMESNVIIDWKFGDTEVSKVDFRIKSLNELTREDLKLKSYIHTSNMVMFDHENKIHKFETLNGILQRFCKERLKLYEKRRKYMLNKIKKLLLIAENKKRFMVDVIDGKIKILLQEDDAVTKQLIEKKYSTDEGSFDYLLNMNIGGFRKNNVEKLEAKIENMKIEIEWFTNTTDGKMWIKDLEELEPFIKI
jgi:DNA topoisomerase-2